MSSVHKYTFDNLTRLGTDSCSLTQDNVMNVSHGNYMLTNFDTADCTMYQPIKFATAQPNVFFKGPKQLGLNGCNVDDHSKLTLGTIQTHPKCRLNLYQRPYLTVPCLARGPHNPVLESQVQQGDHITNKKSISTISEENTIDLHHYPLIPSLKATIANPNNLIEDVADNRWVRGGMPSREYMKSQDYTVRNPAQ
jgi:hypothetical protein